MNASILSGVMSLSEAVDNVLRSQYYRHELRAETSQPRLEMTSTISEDSLMIRGSHIKGLNDNESRKAILCLTRWTNHIIVITARKDSKEKTTFNSISEFTLMNVLIVINNSVRRII